MWFLGYYDEMDWWLVEFGFYFGYVDVVGFFGSFKVVEIGDVFYVVMIEWFGVVL